MLDGSHRPGPSGSYLPGTLVSLWDGHYAIVVADRGEWVLVCPLGEGTEHEYQRSQVTPVRVIEAVAVEVVR